MSQSNRILLIAEEDPPTSGEEVGWRSWKLQLERSIPRTQADEVNPASCATDALKRENTIMKENHTKGQEYEEHGDEDTQQEARVGLS